MRCLYCGKELALLKRWTGGGEFCSDGHRQQYQEEYNQLALTRLLQAKPSGETKSSGSPSPLELKKPEEARKTDPIQRPKPDPTPSAPSPVSTPKSPAVSKPVEEHKLAARRAEPEPVRVTVPVMVEEEEPAPAEPAGFLVEVPVPAMAEVMAMAPSETGLEQNIRPELPRREIDPWGTRLVPAGRVVLQPSDRVLDYTGQAAERRLEARELGHTAPIVEFNLLVAGETGLVKTSEEPMDILILPHPPPGSPLVWQEGEKDFTFETELGTLARVAYGTTGLQDNEDGSAPIPVAIEMSEVAAQVATPTAEKPTAEKRTGPIVVEKSVVPPPASPMQDVAPAQSKETPRPAPILVEAGTTVKPSFGRSPQAPVKTVEAKPEKKPDLLPNLVTKPLPLTLHGLAAGRGKPVQVFPAAVSSGVELQVPRSIALPLRPAMILGPAPAEPAKSDEKKPVERTVVIKQDLRKSQPARPDPRFGNNKGRKPEVRVPDPDKKESDKKEPEKATPVAAIAVNEPLTRPVEQKKPMETKPSTFIKEAVKPSTESSRPSTTYTAPDLGLPSLSLQQSGGFWSKLPVQGKIGIAAGVVLAIAGLVVLMKSGNSPVVSNSPRVVAGQPLTAPDAGWITDWGAEPGVRRQHEISVLRPSLSITDYRMEFEAQIETKALGWVYRAQDGKNYYVSKLEIVKPGLEPTVALIRFAVINGEEQPRSQFPLKIPLRIDTLYKIRFDAVGDHFTTWVQNQQVDDWTDDHIRRGGVGLYNERGERMSLRGSVNVVPLVIKR